MWANRPACQLQPLRRNQLAYAGILSSKNIKETMNIYIKIMI
jgi:hypothetical protein